MFGTREATAQFTLDTLAAEDPADADRTAQQPNHDRVCSARQTAPRGVGLRCRGSPTGVTSLLLSPSASPERVWLYAAELDERLLAPHIPRHLPVGLSTRDPATATNTMSRDEAHVDWQCPKAAGVQAK